MTNDLVSIRVKLNVGVQGIGNERRDTDALFFANRLQGRLLRRSQLDLAAFGAAFGFAAGAVSVYKVDFGNGVAVEIEGLLFHAASLSLISSGFPSSQRIGSVFVALESFFAVRQEGRFLPFKISDRKAAEMLAFFAIR